VHKNFEFIPQNEFPFKDVVSRAFETKTSIYIGTAASQHQQTSGTPHHHDSHGKLQKHTIRAIPLQKETLSGSMAT
jgi:hypothetical protein